MIPPVATVVGVEPPPAPTQYVQPMKPVVAQVVDAGRRRRPTRRRLCRPMRRRRSMRRRRLLPMRRRDRPPERRRTPPPSARPVPACSPRPWPARCRWSRRRHSAQQRATTASGGPRTLPRRSRCPSSARRGPWRAARAEATILPHERSTWHPRRRRDPPLGLSWALGRSTWHPRRCRVRLCWTLGRSTSEPDAVHRAAKTVFGARRPQVHLGELDVRLASLPGAPWVRRAVALVGGVALLFEGEACTGAIYVAGSTIQARGVDGRRCCIAVSSCAPPAPTASPLSPDARLRGQSKWYLDCFDGANQGSWNKFLRALSAGPKDVKIDPNIVRARRRSDHAAATSRRPYVVATPR